MPPMLLSDKLLTCELHCAGPPEQAVGTSRIVKMRGLPFSVAISDILQWFNMGGLNIQPLGPNK